MASSRTVPKDALRWIRANAMGLQEDRLAIGEICGMRDIKQHGVALSIDHGYSASPHQLRRLELPALRQGTCRK